MIHCQPSANDGARIAAAAAHLGVLAADFRRQHRTYAGRAKAARGTWTRALGRETVLFAEVRALLGSMYPSSPGKCMYCEASEASEIEHFRPLKWYPDDLFSWVNYLHACSVCNKKKGSNLVLRDVGGRELICRRARGVAPTPPPPGSPLLVNPRNEDPMQSFSLDLDTGILKESAARGTLGYRRAKHTLDKFHLNKRSLPEQRVATYKHAYRASLRDYVDSKTAGRQPLPPDLAYLSHRLIWEEMKRQTNHPELQPLFAAAPEALAW